MANQGTKRPLRAKDLEPSILQSAWPSKTTKPCQGSPGRVLKMLFWKTLVVGGVARIRGRRGYSSHAHCHHGNRAGYSTGARTRAARRTRSCAARLRHRVPRECRKENHRYQLFHETPQEKNHRIDGTAHISISLQALATSRQPKGRLP
jgi:hypothetical protein